MFKQTEKVAEISNIDEHISRSDPELKNKQKCLYKSIDKCISCTKINQWIFNSTYYVNTVLQQIMNL